MESIDIKRLRIGTVYKLVCVGLLTGLVPLCLFFGILAFFGFDTVEWNGESLTGLKGLLAGPIMGLFLALMFTAFFGSVIALGLWLYSFFKPIRLTYLNVDLD